jgi:hypothetical protein
MTKQPFYAFSKMGVVIHLEVRVGVLGKPPPPACGVGQEEQIEDATGRGTFDGCQSNSECGEIGLQPY